MATLETDVWNTAAQSRGGFSVVALVLRDFSRLAVAEQTKLKTELEAIAANALRRLALSDRLVLDTLDGLVIVILSGPADALDVAENALTSSGELPLCIAINFGPVKRSAEEPARARFMGDGIASAVTLAHLATRGRLLLSRPFRDALGAVAPHRLATLVPVGSMTDATLRSHELYTVNSRATIDMRRRFTMRAGAAVLSILGVGIAIRLFQTREAVIQFEVTPHGDVFIDGEFKGKSPPLTHLPISPGAHTIEVRNDAYAPLRLELNLKPAEEIKVAHAFGSRRSRKEGDSFMEQLWRQLKQ